MRTRARPPAPATGAHQPGIVTRQPPHVALAAFDVVADRHAELAELLAEWSGVAMRLAADPGGLQLTFGLGAALFAPGRFGLDARRPVALAPLPPLPGDALEPARCGGDLCVQVGAREPGALVAALGALAGAARGVAVVRWTQAGFGGGGRRPDGRPRVPRDLLGFLEGADNLRFPQQLERHVWAGAGERTWMAGGTYLVYRRIRLDLASSNALPVDEQERIVGRRRTTGAELVPETGHVALAAPRDGEAGLLRRGFNYLDAAAGTLEPGLAFVAFVRDPRRQYVPVQRRLAQHDALAAFATHTASAVFAIPPAPRPGGFVAERLLDGLAS
ncbi:MAG TPA: Dyp-type peroxidase [Solirubrobacteraceae bacterium]|nr:Dyp-type peroxidase [Solirubrobacteraceae bacterium]